MAQPNASYLITGGTGGLGRSLTHWLVKQGAKNTILASRSGGKNDSTLQLVNEVENLGSGVNIVMAKCDITDREQIQRLTDANCDMRPVRGIIHGAMVLQVSYHFGIICELQLIATTRMFCLKIQHSTIVIML